ncbi:hypothetical protein HDU96_000995 [Phlyctochytrium bullatum]|nr:hypothetical protein HDU96_000995 [Phlyctochytrium bullatum]
MEDVVRQPRGSDPSSNFEVVNHSHDLAVVTRPNQETPRMTVAPQPNDAPPAPVPEAYKGTKLIRWNILFSQAFPGQIHCLHKIQKDRVAQEVPRYLLTRLGPDSLRWCRVETGAKLKKTTWAIPETLRLEFVRWITDTALWLRDTDPAFLERWGRRGGEGVERRRSASPVGRDDDGVVSLRRRSTSRDRGPRLTRSGPFEISPERPGLRVRWRSPSCSATNGNSHPLRQDAPVDHAPSTPSTPDDDRMAWTDLVRQCFSLQTIYKPMRYWTGRYFDLMNIERRKVLDTRSKWTLALPGEHRDEFAGQFYQAFYRDGEWWDKPAGLVEPRGESGDEEEVDELASESEVEDDFEDESEYEDDGEESEEDEYEEEEMDVDELDEYSELEESANDSGDDVDAARPGIGASLRTTVNLPIFINPNGVRIVRYAFLLLRITKDIKTLSTRHRRLLRRGVKNYLLFHNHHHLADIQIPPGPGCKRGSFGVPVPQIAAFLRWAHKEIKRNFKRCAVWSPEEAMERVERMLGGGRGGVGRAA